MDTNPRVAIGGNNPPPDIRAALTAKAADAQQEAADLLASAPHFSTDDQMAAAAAMKRKCGGVRKELDAARKQEKEPHDKAAAEVQAFFLPLIARAKGAEDELDSRMEAELKRRKREKEEQEKTAREEAYRLEREAMKASAAAFEILDKISTGEVVDDGSNHLEAKQRAIEAHVTADAAMAKADKISKQTAGVKVDGETTVRLQSRKLVRLAFPKMGSRTERALALLDFMEHVATARDGYTLTETMTRLANQVYRATRQVPPYCEVYVEESVS